MGFSVSHKLPSLADHMQHLRSDPEKKKVRDSCVEAPVGLGGKERHRNRSLGTPRF